MATQQRARRDASFRACRRGFGRDEAARAANHSSLEVGQKSDERGNIVRSLGCFDGLGSVVNDSNWAPTAKRRRRFALPENQNTHSLRSTLQRL